MSKNGEIDTPLVLFRMRWYKRTSNGMGRNQYKEVLRKRQ